MITVRLASVLYSVIDCNDSSMARKNRLKSMLCLDWLKWILKKDSGKPFKIKGLRVHWLSVQNFRTAGGIKKGNG